MEQSVEILGTGSWLPEQVISNAFLAKKLKIKESDIVKRTGVMERRWVSEKEASSDLATHASMRALQQAGIEGKDLDLIILSSTSPDLRPRHRGRIRVLPSKPRRRGIRAPRPGPGAVP